MTTTHQGQRDEPDYLGLTESLNQLVELSDGYSLLKGVKLSMDDVPAAAKVK